MEKLHEIMLSKKIKTKLPQYCKFTVDSATYNLTLREEAMSTHFLG